MFLFMLGNFNFQRKQNDFLNISNLHLRDYYFDCTGILKSDVCRFVILDYMLIHT